MASLLAQVEQTIKLSREHALQSVHADGHWCGELKSNVTITAEYIFLRQALGLDLKADGAAYSRHILSEQNDDGSWGLAPEHPGDVSTTTEAYLALKILGTDPSVPAMQRARDFVLRAGGVAGVRVFTRIFLATFGLFPWDAVPQLPVELILLPSVCPINIYKLASWARGTIAPLLIICHHRPVYALPYDLDELWQDPTNKHVSYGPSLWELLSQRDMVGLAFSVVDKLLSQLNGLRSIPLLRPYARRQCMRWILQRQEPTGDWGGIFPPMHASVYAFVLEGFALDDPPVRLGLQALENFAWEDERGKRIQACVSPVWDTALMAIGLCDSASASASASDSSHSHSIPSTSHQTNRKALSRAIAWIRTRQLLHASGDWRIYRPQLPPGGFSFEYANSWYPDVDDTAAVILAQIKHDAASITSDSVVAAATWILGMQNPDGGWAAFDVENDQLFLNKIPFSDMDSLCDTSCADITGRVLEAFGLMMNMAGLLPALRVASARGIWYLAATQETNGSWFGRWGCNYLYGTAHALCGLAYFTDVDNHARVTVSVSVLGLVSAGVRWLKTQQNADGGWGEPMLSYRDPNQQPQQQQQQASTASQTAWALMGLLAHLPVTDPAIERGIHWLVCAAAPEESGGGVGVSWPEAMDDKTTPTTCLVTLTMGLFSLFGRARPATVPTDRIIPLRYWDDLDYLRNLCHDFTFRFDAVLDASKLEAALSRLMEIGDWGQLGARLRMNDNRQLEYHIPAEYTPSRPAFIFTTTTYPVDIADHPLASQLPQAGHNQSRLHLPSPAIFAPIVRHPTSPHQLSDWIYTDRPQLHIHVALFEDTTLVTTSYVHTLFDAIARTSFFNAWLAVLNHREDTIPPFVPFSHDPLRDLGKSTHPESFVHYPRILRGLGLIVFGLRYLFELLWFRSEEEHPIPLPIPIHNPNPNIPPSQPQSQSKHNDKPPFLSENDLLTAWYLRTLTLALSLPPHKPLSLMTVFNTWSLFPDLFPRNGAGFIGNAFFYSYTLLTAGDILSDKTLARTALAVRRALAAHRTREQVHAMTAYQRASWTGTPAVVGEPGQVFVACTNQDKAGYFGLDFGGALVGNSAGGVRPSYINDIEHCRGYPTRNVVRIIGRDGAGDWWLLFKTRRGVWEGIWGEVGRVWEMR
ncbi:squalene cyclase [Aspergillus heteromorphus CBS 117.55]|uniref:Squalene cyclase n=1 Tax=Aspergillus heteromorphus CBS 117.55 TaxID=1448321 RepID=A0A317WMG5_9EURO|nr:squalene cyclase [Aspergillus heteromorphus CBS 117.55]PWY87559.1 squalene cyclase [Aspergillus heteromorphus CBS 117.55]